MRRTALAFFLALVSYTYAQDIQTGETFVDGQQIFAADLNNAINGATIIPSFLTGKSTATPVSADLFLFYQGGTTSLKKSTFAGIWGAIFPANANTNQFVNGNGALTGVHETAFLFTDILTANVNFTSHGLVPKAPNNSDLYFSGDGTYRIPAVAPENLQNANYTFVLADAGKLIFHDEAFARTYTIPSNAAVAFRVGTIITIANNVSGGNITLTINTDTLRRGDGTSGSGNRVIPANSVATLIKIAATQWMLTGAFN